MWEQKKGNTPQTYPPLYGQNSGPQIPQQMQQSFQSMPQYSHAMQHQMSQMGQPLTPGMTQGLGPPPPYSPYSEQQQQQMKYMSQMQYQNQYMAANPGAVSQQHQSPLAGAHPHSYANPYQSNLYPNPSLYNPYNPYQSLGSNPQTVVMPHAFEAGARFDGLSRPGVPPPPPGVAPNAAQMAALQGQNVVLGQKKGSFLEGGSSGGYTFW